MSSLKRENIEALFHTRVLRLVGVTFCEIMQNVQFEQFVVYSFLIVISQVSEIK